MQTFAWLFWISILSYFVAFQIIITISSDPGIGLLCLFCGIVIFIPSSHFAILLTHLFLLEKERINPDFKIKQNKITSNIIYKIFTIFSFILEWIALAFLTFCIFYIFIDSELPSFIFIRFSLPILIIELVIYLLLRKKYLL